MMERPREDAADEVLVGAFVEHANEQAWPLSTEQLEGGWQRLRGSLATSEPQVLRPSRRRARIRPWLVGFASAAAVTALAIFALRLLPRRSEPALRYTVENLVMSSGNSFASSAKEGSGLRFSDGSRVAFGTGTQLILYAIDAHGARMNLVNGAVDVDVKPRSKNAWSFAAGPFRVKVKGTAFHLEFTPEHGRLNLRMKHGLVEVSAPPSRTIAVAAGESIELFAEQPPVENQLPASAELPLGDGNAEAHHVDEANGASPVRSPRAETASPRSAARHGAVRAFERSELATDAPAADWSKLINQGDFSAVVADAERRGLDNTIARASAPDLSYLADAARYTRRLELARRVLLAMRARFAGSQPARDASFFLGRLAETAPDRSEGAITWYETYLREAPRGTYASEAMGREMTLLAPTAPREARKLARQYIERFPRGSQAELAHSLLETNSE